MIVEPLALAHVGAFALAGLVCLAGAARARRLERVGGPLAAFLVVTGVWAGVEVVRFAVPSTDAKVVLYTVSLVVGLWSVYAWLWFCTVYAETRVPRPVAVAAAGLFVAVSALKLTNPVHGWYFDASLVAEPFTHLAVYPAPVHWVVTAGAYVAALWGFALVAGTLADEGRETRYLVAVLVFLVLPVVPSIASLAAPTLLPSVFYEPLGAAAFAVAALVAVEAEFDAVAPPARHQLVDQLPVPVVVLDDEDRVVESNAAATALWPALVEGERPDGALLGVADADGVVTLPTADGDRSFLVDGSPVGVGDRTVGRTLLFTDVTALETARRELDRQNAQLDELAEAVTHELRNPLNVALGSLGDAAAASDETVRDAVRTARAANERMVDIVDDLRTMTRYGKSVGERTETALAPVVREAWDGVDAPESTLSVDGSATVVVDPGRFVEMCERTFAFCLDRGATAVTVQPTPDGFGVETNCAPVGPDAAEALFEYGQQAATDDRMGLALVGTLAAAQGWSVRIDTEAPCLRFEFRAAAPASSP